MGLKDLTFIGQHLQATRLANPRRRLPTPPIELHELQSPALAPQAEVGRPWNGRHSQHRIRAGEAIQQPPFLQAPQLQVSCLEAPKPAVLM